MHMLAVAAAVIVAAVGLSFGIAWFAISRPIGKRLDGIERALKGTGRELARIDGIVQAGMQSPAVAMPARGSPVSAGELAKPVGAAPETSMPMVATAKRPEPRPPSRSDVRRDRTERYRDLLEHRAKPRQLQDVIEEDDDARAITCASGDNVLRFATFDANDPSQMLVALAGPDEGSFIVFPTSEYLENFRVAFRAPVQNPAIVHSLFDLQQDDEDGLRVLEPALVRVDETGLPHKHRTGRLGGFSSAG